MNENVIDKIIDFGNSPNEKFVVYPPYQDIKTVAPESQKEWASLDIVSSENDVLRTIIWVNNQGIPPISFMIWDVFVDLPTQLSSWTDKDVLAYTQDVFRRCRNLDKEYYLLPMSMRENSEAIFHHGAKMLENWLLAVKENVQYRLSQKYREEEAKLNNRSNIEPEKVDK